MEQKESVSKLQQCKRVHYPEREFEETITEGDNISALTENTKSSYKYQEDAPSEISISTSILDVEEQDVRTLRKKLEDYEYKLKYLENENNQVNADLLSERAKNSKLEKKLQFVKDNQEVFMRLKEAYINMKYNEAAGRKMIEIREKGIQTWKGAICSSCIESEELRRQIDIMIQKYSELFVVSPGEMEHLVNTVKYLKDLIDRREKSWAFNMEREHKLQNHIAILEKENTAFRDLLANRQNISEPPIEDVKLEKKLLEEKKVQEMQKFVESVTKDTEKLKKIIMKYEKKFREMKERYPSKFVSPLNEKEYKIVQQIITKYNAKYQKSSEKLQRCRSVSNDRESSQTRRPSSPLKGASRSKEDSEMRPQTSNRPRSGRSYDRKAESAIMMLDCLFD